MTDKWNLKASTRVVGGEKYVKKRNNMKLRVDFQIDFQNIYNGPYCTNKSTNNAITTTTTTARHPFQGMGR